MNNNNGKGREIFYGVIGVSTLVVAIIGATFAYFTASAQNNAITGNAATISLGLAVTKETTADVDKGGMIPMSNNMVEAAISDASSNGVCVDDTGNAVCQVYKVVLTNKSTAAVFVDGYVALTGGSPAADDMPAAGHTNTVNHTDMRWAQVFKNGETYTTAGTQVLSAGSTGANTDTGTDSVAFTTLDASGDSTGFNTSHILTDESDITTSKEYTSNGNTYKVVNANFIRVSDGTASPNGDTPFDRTTDVTSALVYSQNIASNNATSTYYFVVWLSDSGVDQTLSSETTPTATNFFGGVVKFLSAQGSEVSATFNGYTRVAPTDTGAAGGAGGAAGAGA